MNGLSVLATATLATCFSTVVLSGPPPKAPDSIYGNGPLSPLQAKLDLSHAEMTAYALYEGVMQVTEAKIHATSCGSSAGTYNVTIFTDGSKDNRPLNFVDVISLGGSFTLNADLYPSAQFRGQKILIGQDEPGSLLDTDVSGYDASATYNASKNMLWQKGRVDVRGINGSLINYKSMVIKDFIRGSLDSNDRDYYTVLDWGLDSLHKLGFPANKYWQRSKSRRSDGDPGRTIFVKDRLLGSTACRIIIDTMGVNNQDIFWQDGTLTIELINPSAPVPAFSDFPF